MALSINAAIDSNANAECDENESPLSPLGKRKSDRISPDANAANRGPLFEVSANHEKAASTNETLSSTPSKAYKTPPSPLRTSLPPLSASRFSINSSANKFNSSAGKFKPRPTKDEIQATDDKQASVNQLSEWLATESAKKTKRPPIHRPLPNSTPIQFNAKPRIKKKDVEATDDKRVSVKTLSSWMSNDPFEQKKVRTIRSGHKIIAKSRIFEKDTALAASRQCDIKAGSVCEKQAFLNQAFKHEDDGAQPLREHKIRPYQQKKECTPVKELKSVQDKKEWLSSAFKKSGGDGEQQQQHNIGTPTIHQTKSFEHHTRGTPSAI
ncbi:hypothetical protein ACHAXR_003868, partial [Thalassiosira sp. AJA248-18]